MLNNCQFLCKAIFKDICHAQQNIISIFFCVGNVQQNVTRKPPYLVFNFMVPREIMMSWKIPIENIIRCVSLVQFDLINFIVSDQP